MRSNDPVIRHVLITDQKVSLDECVYSLPWRNDLICMNFDPPETMVLPEDIPLLNRDEIETIVIGCSLEDYAFLKEFHSLRELYIFDGSNVKDLSFVETMTFLKQFVLYHSHIHSVQPLVTLLERKKESIKGNQISDWFPYTMEGICIRSDQNITDQDSLYAYHRYVSEIILSENSQRSFHDPYCESSIFLCFPVLTFPDSGILFLSINDREIPGQKNFIKKIKKLFLKRNDSPVLYL